MDFFGFYCSHPFLIPTGPVPVKASGETAIYVLSRVAGEGADRHAERGDYYLTKEEEKFLEAVCSLYAHVVLLINTGGVVDLSGIAAEPRNGAYVDDPAASLARENGIDLLYQVERALQIHGDNIVEILFLQCENEAVARDARVVYENIDRAEFGDDRFESFFDCVVIGDIAFICAALYTARLDRCFAFLGGAVV